MKKNSADQIGANGIMLRARGYATKAKPGPKHHSSFVMRHTVFRNKIGHFYVKTLWQTQTYFSNSFCKNQQKISGHITITRIFVMP